MNLIKRNNKQDNFSTMLESLFNDNFGSLPSAFNGGFGNSPAVNISENENDYKLEIAVPGMKKDDFRIELDNDMLTVSAEIEHKDEDEKDNYFRREFTHQSFSRSFHLPENKVKEDKIKANYNDGVLYVTLPKRDEAKPSPSRMIDIS